MKLYQNILALLLMLVVAVPIAVYGDAESYEGLTTAPTELVTNSSGDSLAAGSTPLAGRSIAVSGDPTCYVKADLSGSAGDTVTVYAFLWMKRGTTWTFLGVQEATLTAGAATDAASDNLCPLAVFDTAAATYVEVRAAAPSAGTVDLTYWCGAASGS